MNKANDRLLADLDRAINMISGAVAPPAADDLGAAENFLAQARKELQEQMAAFDTAYRNVVDAVDYVVDCVDRVEGLRNPR
jgi:flagellin-like hook-associated protein FlgL